MCIPKVSSSSKFGKLHRHTNAQGMKFNSYNYQCLITFLPCLQKKSCIWQSHFLLKVSVGSYSFQHRVLGKQFYGPEPLREKVLPVQGKHHDLVLLWGTALSRAIGARVDTYQISRCCCCFMLNIFKIAVSQEALLRIKLVSACTYSTTYCLLESLFPFPGLSQIALIKRQPYYFGWSLSQSYLQILALISFKQPSKL